MQNYTWKLISGYFLSFFFFVAVLQGHSQERVLNLRLEPIIYQSGLEVPPLEHAFVTYDMLPGTGMEYFNARFINPQTESVAWLIRNVPIPPISDFQTVAVIINQSFIGTDYPFLICEYISSPVWLTDSMWGPPFQTIILNPEVTTYRVGSGSDDLQTIPSLNPLPLLIPPPPLNIEFEYRGCEVPNIDLDNQTFYPPSNAIPNDKNSCGPAAAGNSLHWLVAQHTELAGDTTTLREKVDKLKQYMKMQKDDPNGVRFDSMVVGKLALIDELMLPIKVKYQTEHASGNDQDLVSTDPRFGHFAHNEGGAGMSPTFDWLMQEMEDGEDVELHVGWYNGGVRNGGHWYVVTGYFRGDSAKGVWLKEDTDQDSMGGTRQEYFEWKTDANGFPYLSGITSGAYGGHIESLVSESYDSTMTFIDLSDFDWTYRPLVYATTDKLSYSHDAFLYFTIPPSLSEPYISMNISACVPGDTEIDWVIHNLPITNTMISMGEHYRMDLYDALHGQPMPETLRVYISLGDFGTDFNDPFMYHSFIDLVASPFMHRTGHGAVIGYHPMIPNFSGIFLPPVPPILPFPMEYRGCEVPNIDLDSTMYPFVPADPDATDYCACGPAAAANSLEWLDLMHDEIDIPGDIRSSLDSLKRMMKLNKDVDPEMPNLEDFGVEYVDFIKGKLEFIDKYQLPIHVKYQSHIGPPSVQSPNMLYGHSATNENNPAVNHPEYSWLASEMEAGEDVEVMIGYYKNPVDTIMLGQPLPAGFVALDTADVLVIIADTTQRYRDGGHFINVTGYIDLGNTKWIIFKHDPDQDGPEGAIEEWSEWVMDTANYSYLQSMSRGVTRSYVETVVSESYDSTILFCPDKVCIPDDNGDGSLRKALICAEAGDTILFAEGMNGQTITLTSGPLLIHKSVVIMASPGSDISISGQGITRVMEIGSSIPTEIIELRLVGGHSSQGAAIVNEGFLKLKNVQVINGQPIEIPGLVLNQNGGEITIEGTTNVKVDH